MTTFSSKPVAVADAKHTVTILRDGFDWQGRKFKSLSAVARNITGVNWNGYRFFGLGEARRNER